MTDQQSLTALLEEFLADELAADPITATAVGVVEHDHRMPDLSADGVRRRQDHEDRWVQRLTAVDPATLTEDERIDRDLVLMTLSGRAVMRDWQEWRRNADRYVSPGMNGVHYLMLHRLRPEAELVEAAAARLEQVPDVLAAGRANLDADLAAPLLLERAARSARATAQWLRTDLRGLVEDDVARRRLAEAGSAAAAAYDGFVTHLDRLGEHAMGGFAIGEDRYDALLREAEGLGYGARGLRDRGQAEYDALDAELRGRTRDLAGHDDWAAYARELDADAPATPEEMLAAYTDWTQRARAFCVEHDLVSFPAGEECRVLPAPPFARAIFAVAFYARPPAFSDRLAGHFFVPYPPEGAPAGQAAQRLAANSYAVMPAVAVHEAYPGHHWHLSWVASRRLSPVRRVLGSSYLSEGWGLYTERLLGEHGFYADPRQALKQVVMRQFRAARIIADTSLHLGEMSVEEAVGFMRDKGGQTEDVARAEVTRYCAWPTQAASYLTGAIEVERMRDAWLTAGRGTLKEFHDTLAGSGVLPLELAERVVSRA